MPIQSILKVLLERRILLALIDMLGDRRANYLRHGPGVNTSDCFQRFRLLGGESNSHGFGWFHSIHIPH